MNLTVLYEDNHLIAVFKPAGVLTQKDKTNEESLMEVVKEYLKEKYRKPGNVFLGMLHRLDRPVAGIVLFAKTSKGASRLSEQFRAHEVEKMYHAVVLGRLDKSKGRLVNYLRKNPSNNKVSVYNEVVPESGLAELYYETVASNEKYSLLKIRLITGKSHQIRAQFAFLGHPLLGDIKYGAPQRLNDKSIALCATGLKFRLPTKDEEKEIIIETPLNWKDYLEALQ
ncbi:MAG: RluA family pseudouridine synthase [bacterium]